LLIFMARLADVSLATLRHSLISRGQKRIVPVFAFVEVIIWLLAISQVMNNLNNVACFLAWALGFSAGTYLGMAIEESLAIGYQLVRIIAQGNTDDIARHLKDEGYGLTTVGGSGSQGSVGILLVISKRKNLERLLGLLNSLTPKPFYTVEDVRSVGSSIIARTPVLGNLSMEGSVKRK